MSFLEPFTHLLDLTRDEFTVVMFVLSVVFCIGAVVCMLLRSWVNVIVFAAIAMLFFLGGSGNAAYGFYLVNIKG